MTRFAATLLLLCLTAACNDGSLAGPGGQHAAVIHDPAAIADPSRAVVIVYNHSTLQPRRREDCSAAHNAVPDSLRRLAMDRLYIYFLCSRALERLTPPTGDYVDQRVDEITLALSRLRAEGVTPRRTFLAGHSAGAWAALMTAVDHGDAFNGIVAFAPTFAGPRSETDAHPQWRLKARPRQIRQMQRAPRMDALVFAYRGDPFNRPQDLSFLTEAWPGSVTLIGYGCNNAKPHLTHLRDCRQNETRQRIRAFIEARLAATVR